MDKDKFNKAIELNNKIEEYKDHKMALENSNIKYGGGLIFTYNRMHNDVPLKEEIFGKNFFQLYLYALDSKIKELQKEFDELWKKIWNRQYKKQKKNIPMIAETGSVIVNRTALLTLFLAHNGSQSNRLG